MADQENKISGVELPFPQTQGMTHEEETSAMFDYILSNQNGSLEHLKMNLRGGDSTWQINRFRNILETGDYKGNNCSKENAERLLKTWQFIQDNFNDPRLSWLKEIDEKRRAAQSVVGSREYLLKQYFDEESRREERGKDSWPDPTMRFADGIPLNMLAGLVIPKLRPLGREDNYAGSVIDSEIPFPQLQSLTPVEQSNAVFEYITQRDIINYLDWNLWITDAESHVTGIVAELKDTKRTHFSYAGTRVDHEHLLKTWQFVKDHLDDPRLSWLKKVDEYRSRTEYERVQSEKAAQNVNINPPVAENLSPQITKAPEKTLREQVIDDHEVPSWMLQNFKSMPPKSVVEAFKDIAARDSDPESRTQLEVIQYVVEHLEQYPTVVKEIEDRKDGTTKW